MNPFALLAGLFIFAEARSRNVIVDGGFETVPAASLNTQNVTAGNWTLEDQVVLLSNNGQPSASQTPYGHQFARFQNLDVNNPRPTGSISQAVTIETGGMYTSNFSYQVTQPSTQSCFLQTFYTVGPTQYSLGYFTIPAGSPSDPPSNWTSFTTNNTIPKSSGVASYTLFCSRTKRTWKFGLDNIELFRVSD